MSWITTWRDETKKGAAAEGIIISVLEYETETEAQPLDEVAVRSRLLGSLLRLPATTKSSLSAGRQNNRRA